MANPLRFSTNFCNIASLMRLHKFTLTNPLFKLCILPFQWVSTCIAVLLNENWGSKWDQRADKADTKTSPSPKLWLYYHRQLTFLEYYPHSEGYLSDQPKETTKIDLKHHHGPKLRLNSWSALQYVTDSHYALISSFGKLGWV